MSFTEIQTLDAMNEHGDKFSRALAHLYSVADYSQRIHIRESFHDEWARASKYAELAKEGMPEEPFI